LTQLVRMSQETRTTWLAALGQAEPPVGSRRFTAPSRSRSQTCSSTTPAADPTSEPPVGCKPVAVSQRPARPAPLPTSDQRKARTAGHRSARRTKHHLQSLVGAAPPPVVAELLGYSYKTTQLHAAIAPKCSPANGQPPRPTSVRTSVTDEQMIVLADILPTAYEVAFSMVRYGPPMSLPSSVQDRLGWPR